MQTARSYPKRARFRRIGEALESACFHSSRVAYRLLPEMVINTDVQSHPIKIHQIEGWGTFFWTQVERYV